MLPRASRVVFRSSNAMMVASVPLQCPLWACAVEEEEEEKEEEEEEEEAPAEGKKRRRQEAPRTRPQHAARTRLRPETCASSFEEATGLLSTAGIVLIRGSGMTIEMYIRLPRNCQAPQLNASVCKNTLELPKTGERAATKTNISVAELSAS